MSTTRPREVAPQHIQAAWRRCDSPELYTKLSAWGTRSVGNLIRYNTGYERPLLIHPSRPHHCLTARLHPYDLHKNAELARLRSIRELLARTYHRVNERHIRSARELGWHKHRAEGGGSSLRCAFMLYAIHSVFLSPDSSRSCSSSALPAQH